MSSTIARLVAMRYNTRYGEVRRTLVHKGPICYDFRSASFPSLLNQQILFNTNEVLILRNFFKEQL